MPNEATIASEAKRAVEVAREVYRDHRRRVILPLDPLEPPLEMRWVGLQKLLADRRRIEHDTAQVRAAIAKLEAGVREAQAQDTRELASKLRATTRAKPPEVMDAHEQAAKQALDNARRRLTALEQAAKMVEDEIAALVAVNAPDWAKECRARERKAAKKLAGAAEKLQDAHAELSAARRLGAWCADPSMRTKPGWAPGDGVKLGYDLPSGDPAEMGVGEFIGMMLSQELRDGTARA